jgi:hypothetical protein
LRVNDSQATLHIKSPGQLASGPGLSLPTLWPGLSFLLCYFRPMPRTFLYRCPNTGQTVQGWSADEAADEDDTYQSFQCIACTRVHLVNLKTRKVLGEREE